MTEAPPTEFNRTLTLFDAVGVVICAMIGSGIFIVSAQTAMELQSGGLLLLAWLISGIMTIMGALAYGELAALWPNVGGQYTYIKNTWGQPTAFVYGWTLSFVIKAGSIAAVAIGFSKFLGVFFPILHSASWQLGGLALSSQKITACLLIVALTLINTNGVKLVARIQNLVTVTNIAALALIIVTGLFLGFSQPVFLQNFKGAFALPPLSAAWILTLGMALVGPLFAMDGWNNVTFLAAEIKQPSRNLPLALILGAGLTTLLYILVNGVYLSVLPLQAIINAPDGVVGASLMKAVLGHPGELLIAGIIMIAAFGCVNSMILSGSRAIYALAKDGLLVKGLSNIGKNSQVPENALYIQCVWSVILVLSRAFSELLDYMVFASILFYGITVAGLFILRKKQGKQSAVYRAWGYPYLPILYCLLCIWIEVSLILYKPVSAGISLGIVLLGLPIYFLIPKQPYTKEEPASLTDASTQLEA